MDAGRMKHQSIPTHSVPRLRSAQLPFFQAPDLYRQGKVALNAWFYISWEVCLDFRSPITMKLALSFGIARDCGHPCNAIVRPMRISESDKRKSRVCGSPEENLAREYRVERNSIDFGKSARLQKGNSAALSARLAADVMYDTHQMDRNHNLSVEIRQNP